MPTEITLLDSTKKATVDDADADYINQWDWHFDEESGYAYRIEGDEFILMQNQVMARHDKNVN